MERGFLNQKGSRVGRGVKVKQSSLDDKSVEVSKHVNEALGTNTRNPNVVNAGLGSYLTLSEAHGHSLISANKEDMNDVGTINNVANNVTKVGPTPAGNGVVASHVIMTSTPCKSNSYANVTREPSRKSVNFLTLITPAGNKHFEDYHGDGNKDGSTAAKEKGGVKHFGITLEKEEEGKHNATAQQDEEDTARIKCYICQKMGHFDLRGLNALGMEQGFLNQKGSRVGRGVKVKQSSLDDKSVEVSKHVNEVLGTNTRNPNVVNAGLGSYLTLSEAHGHSLISANKEDMNDVGTINNVANNVTKVGPTPAGNGVVASHVIMTSTPCKSNSYANVTREPSRKSVNFLTLITPAGNKVDVVVPVESIRAVSERFANTAYGFFLIKRVAYHVLANYVRNTWGKYGLVKSMFNSSNELFYFYFSSIEGLDAMLENGSWFIRNNLLIQKKWNPDLNLLKEDVGKALKRVDYLGDINESFWKPHNVSLSAKR
ncbi:retrotransposon protein, putative, unclassified [Tanacetum coccineum]